MTKNPVVGKSADLAPVRSDHPDQMLEQINDAFYEAADAVARLRDQLGLLVDQLESRFLSEDQSGWFEEVLCHAPWLTPQAQQLHQQQAPLIEMVRNMQRACDAESSPSGWWDRLRRDFAEFNELLQDHEQAKNRLWGEVNPGLGWASDND